LDIELIRTLLIGAAGSLLAALFIFISFKVIPYIASKSAQFFGFFFKRGVNVYEQEAGFATSAIDNADYSALLCFFFYRLYQIIFSLSIATIFIVIAAVYSSQGAKALAYSVGFTALIYGVIYQGGLITKVYIYLRSKDG
jgi:hypothetical protein